MPQDSWTFLGSRYVGEYRVLRLREDRYRFEPSGDEADFVVCESADWVLVIPFTADGQVVLVRQYRHGVQQVVLEVPGGIVDENESPMETAARELQEETGFTAESIQVIGRLMPNPALNDAYCHVAVATGCRRTAEPSFDPMEKIEVVLTASSEIPSLIRSGELSHAQVIAAFALLQMAEGTTGPATAFGLT
ncbi:MAG: NUDIX hydrolase [Planctomycetes bacterium]|nr:NUDIX hydrolase [Planctomycetota bacterium]MBL7038416.1 NUDIX hydrolase [Pirellulaceae bacterium]